MFLIGVSQELISLGLNLSPIGSTSGPTFVSLVVVRHVADIIFSFNKSFLTCHSRSRSLSQQAPLLEAIKQQPHFLFLYSAALKYLITEWINMDACPALPG